MQLKLSPSIMIGLVFFIGGLALSIPAIWIPGLLLWIVGLGQAKRKQRKSGAGEE